MLEFFLSQVSKQRNVSSSSSGGARNSVKDTATNSWKSCLRTEHLGPATSNWIFMTPYRVDLIKSWLLAAAVQNSSWNQFGNNRDVL